VVGAGALTAADRPRTAPPRWSGLEGEPSGVQDQIARWPLTLPSVPDQLIGADNALSRGICHHDPCTGGGALLPAAQRQDHNPDCI
jgi:hypothetical protein